MRDRQASGSFAGTAVPTRGRGARTAAETGFIYALPAGVPEDFPSRAPAGRKPSPPETSPIGRHCWVIDPGGSGGSPQAGLLVDWRRAPDGWWGRVVLASSTPQGRPTVTDTWLPAARLKPAGTP